MDCIFCKIASGEISSQKIYEDDLVIAFNDLEPQAPVHVLIIPKKHIESLNDLSAADSFIVGHIFNVAKKIAHDKKIDKTGYRIINNCGKNGGQSVMHMHFHLLGGRPMKWPAG